MANSPTKLSRRTIFAGVGAAGAVAAITAVVPTQGPVEAAPEASALPKPERGGGYRLSEHVKRYYETTRL